MNRQITRRGPDDEGYFIEDGAGLAMRRLSIQDISGGHQPIFNGDRSAVIVFNGEIYNFRELRAELVGRGHRFDTNSDTEVIIHLYDELGPACVHRLRGMFAFAIWDRRRRSALVARDRLGIKPLYYAQVGDAILFGSEIKAVLASGLVRKEVDPQAVDAFFTYTYIPAPYSIFTGIRKLPAGSLMEVDSNGFTIRRYWDVEFEEEDSTVSLASLEQSVSSSLEDAVRSHLVSDVEVGSFLSGGVDSGVVTSIAALSLSGSPKTFTIGFPSQGNPLIDERAYARRVSEIYGTDHREMEVKPDFRSIAGDIVRAFDEPFADDSVIPSYYVCEMASRDVKVALSGLGGDELFAGYFRYQGLALSGIYERIPALLRRYVFGPMARLIPEPRSGGDFTNHLKRFIAAGELPAAERYLSYVSSLGRQERTDLYADSRLRRINFDETSDVILSPFRRCPAKSLLQKAIYTDLHTYLPDDILALSDRLSMWHSLELRVPLVDHELLALAVKIPPRRNMAWGKKKRLLKRVAKSWLPDEIINHKKQGFESPMGSWLRGELRDFATQLLDPGRLERQGLFNPEFVGKRLADHLSLRQKNNKFIFSMMMFQLWWDTCMTHDCEQASQAS